MTTTIRKTSVVPVTGPSDREAFSRTDWALFSVIGVVWGSSFLLIKLGLASLHPGFITFARVGLGALVLFALRRDSRRIEAIDRRNVISLSILWVGVPFTLFPLAEQHISSVAAGLLTGATPFFAGLFGSLWYGRTTRGPQRWGIGVGFVGVALIAVGSGSVGGTAPTGVAMVLVATACYGMATNMAGPLQHKYGSVRLMGVMLALGSLWTAPFGLFGLTYSMWNTGSVVATGVLGVIGTGLAFVLMASLVGRVGGPRSSFITYLMPLVALLMGATFLGESVTPWAVAGSALMVGAAMLASRAEVR